MSTEGRPLTIPLPPGGFETIRDGIVSQAEALRAETSETGRLSVVQEYSLYRAASAGVLGLLQRMGVRGAATLAGELSTGAETDPYTDLVDIATKHGNHARLPLLLPEDASQTDEEPSVDSAERQRLIDEQKLSLLAEAVGATANSAVAVLTGGDYKAETVQRARREVMQAGDPELEAEQVGSSIGSVATKALTDILDAVEATPAQMNAIH